MAWFSEPAWLEWDPNKKFMISTVYKTLNTFKRYITLKKEFKVILHS